MGLHYTLFTGRLPMSLCRCDTMALAEWVGSNADVSLERRRVGPTKISKYPTKNTFGAPSDRRGVRRRVTAFSRAYLVPRSDVSCICCSWLLQGIALRACSISLSPIFKSIALHDIQARQGPPTTLVGESSYNPDKPCKKSGQHYKNHE